MAQADDIALILKERVAAYGQFGDNAELAHALMVEMRGPEPLADVVLEGMVHMIAFKASRLLIGGRFGDSVVDAVGYLRLTVADEYPDGLPISLQTAALPPSPVRSTATAGLFAVMDKAAHRLDIASPDNLRQWLQLVRVLSAVRLALRNDDLRWRLAREASAAGLLAS